MATRRKFAAVYDSIVANTYFAAARPVRQSSVSKGFIAAEVAARLSDTEATDLIFSPGTSTAEETTEISGRGVGMDIVKTNIESINGFVNLDTRVGEGTKFTLMLPLRLLADTN